jgi:hypothetical protein
LSEFSELDYRFRPAPEWIAAVARRYLGGVAVTSTLRSPHQQAQLVQQLGGVQVCPVGTSTHQVGLAVDLVVPQGSDSDAQRWLGWVWNTYVYPGTWSAKDPVHFSCFKGCL